MQKNAANGKTLLNADCEKPQKQTAKDRRTTLLRGTKTANSDTQNSKFPVRSPCITKPKTAEET